MKIGVVGGGVVGHATARAFIEHIEEVRVYDVVKERATHSLPEVLQCDLIFVCLPTPQKQGELKCELTYVDDFFGSVRRYGGNDNTNFVLRSTVPIGTTNYLRFQHSLDNLVHSPEFLTARCAVTDAQLPSRNIIGSALEHHNNYTCKGHCAIYLNKLYEVRFPNVPVYHMTSDESEAVKLFQNSFFAVKVAFFNEINTLSQRLGLDWQVIVNAMLADGRISPSHTTVPGPDGKYGFGGECLPKDLASLVSQMYDAKCINFVDTYSVSKAAMLRNIQDRKRT